MAKNDKVTWAAIKTLAENVDKLYTSKLKEHRPKLDACVNNETESSFVQGIPKIAKDITTPFPLPVSAFTKSVTLYQRFEFAYYEEQNGELMYQYYKDGIACPIYHSEYLTKSYLSDDKTYVAPGELGLGNNTENICNLIEVNRANLSKWWPNCSFYSETDEIAAELYFVSDQSSMCPCPAVYRVAYAVSGGNNGNGNGMSSTGVRHYLDSGSVHTWSLKSACTLEEVGFAKLGPEDCIAGTPTYIEPPTGCCAKAEFPKLGDGAKDTIMYDTRLFLPSYYGATTKPFTPVVSDMPYAEYIFKKGNGTLPPHCMPKELSLYQQNSTTEMWEMCLEGVQAAVRITTMAFRKRDQAGNIYVDIVKVPTSVTIKLTGSFKPAIRQRWYDMIFYKLRFIAGSFVSTGDLFPKGTTWNSEGETLLASYDKPCSRYLALGYGWKKHNTAEFIARAYYGEKFMEQMICAKNYAGGITCPGTGEFNKAGGFCSELVGPANDCRDLACHRAITLPWEGGCDNQVCGTGNSTMYDTVSYLTAITNFIEMYKLPEPINQLTLTKAWESCAVTYQKNEEKKIPYRTTNFNPGPVVDPYGYLIYHTYDYVDTGCTGCTAGAECDFTVTGSAGSSGASTVGNILLNPNNPIIAGMAYCTFLNKETRPSILRVTIHGQIDKLLVPGDKYYLVGNQPNCVYPEVNYCQTKDVIQGPDYNPLEHGIVVAGPCTGGVLTATAYYGPDGKEMKKAEGSLLFKRTSEDMIDVTHTFELPLNTENYQYRCNVVIYIEAWLAGTGEDNPYVLLLDPDKGCFKAQNTTLTVTIENA